MDKELEDQLQDKRVLCPTDGCSFSAPLRVFLLHCHGRTNYSNADVDFNRIQAERSRFIPLPSLAALETDSVATGPRNIREQLQQACRFSVYCNIIAMAIHIYIYIDK